MSVVDDFLSEVLIYPKQTFILNKFTVTTFQNNSKSKVTAKLTKSDWQSAAEIRDPKVVIKMCFNRKSVVVGCILENKLKIRS